MTSLALRVNERLRLRFPRALPLAIMLGCALATAGCRSPQQRAAAAAQLAAGYAVGGDLVRARLEIRNAIRFDEDNPDYWAALARLELQLGNPPGAYAAYQRVYELQRSNVEALEWLSTLSVAGGDELGAKNYLDALMVLSPNSIRGRLAQGTLAVRNDHFDDAIAIADGVLKDNPAVPDAAILKANALDKVGRRGDAIAALEDQVGRNPQAAVPLLQQALELYKKADDAGGIHRTYARLFKLQPDNAALQIEYARALFARGETAEAARAVAEVQRRHPADAGAQLLAIRYINDTAGRAAALAELGRAAARAPALRAPLAGYLLDEGAAAQARALVEPLAAGKPINSATVDAQITYAGALKQLGDTPRARALLDQILAFDETNSKALLVRAQMELAAHQLNEALRDIRIVVRDTPDDVTANLLLAAVYGAQGDDRLARQTFAGVLGKNPASEAALTAYTDYLIGKRDLAAALNEGSDFVKANPTVPGGWFRMGQICLQAGDEACVRGTAQRLAALDSPRARLLLATVSSRKAAGAMLPQGLANAVAQVVAGAMPLDAIVRQLVAADRLADARALVTQVVRRQPDNSFAQVVQADLQMLGGDAAGGRASLQRVIARFPDQMRARADLAFSLHKAGDDAGGFAVIRQGLARNRNNSDLLNSLASLQIATGHAGDAIATLRTLAARLPGNLVVLNNLAAMLADYGRTPAERREAATIADRMAGQDAAGINDTRGWAYFRAGDRARAVPLLQRAVKQSPDSAVFAYHLGAVALAGGDQAQGRKLIQEALRRAARDDRWVADARARLDRG